jgi:hypothetical protein
MTITLAKNVLFTMSLFCVFGQSMCMEDGGVATGEPRCLKHFAVEQFVYKREQRDFLPPIKASIYPKFTFNLLLFGISASLAVATGIIASKTSYHYSGGGIAAAASLASLVPLLGLKGRHRQLGILNKSDLSEKDCEEITDMGREVLFDSIDKMNVEAPGIKKFDANKLVISYKGEQSYMWRSRIENSGPFGIVLAGNYNNKEWTLKQQSEEE